jgi:hypothetical protein
MVEAHLSAGQLVEMYVRAAVHPAVTAQLPRLGVVVDQPHYTGNNDRCVRRDRVLRASSTRTN